MPDADGITITYGEYTINTNTNDALTPEQVRQQMRFYATPRPPRLISTGNMLYSAPTPENDEDAEAEEFEAETGLFSLNTMPIQQSAPMPPRRETPEYLPRRLLTGDNNMPSTAKCIKCGAENTDHYAVYVYSWLDNKMMCSACIRDTIRELTAAKIGNLFLSKLIKEAFFEKAVHILDSNFEYISLDNPESLINELRNHIIYTDYVVTHPDVRYLLRQYMSRVKVDYIFKRLLKELQKTDSYAAFLTAHEHTCSVCGKKHYTTKLLWNGGSICAQCSYHKGQCNRCHGFILNNTDRMFIDDILICPDCYGNLPVCTDCGNLIYFSSNGVFLCRRCRDRRAQLAPINTYHDAHRYVWHFLPDHKQLGYYGVELEVTDFSDEEHRLEAVKDIYDNFGRERELLTIESDSSLNNGFEVITNPMGYEYIRKNFDWKKLTQIIKKKGGKADEATKAGLHIHFSKSLVGNTSYEVNTTTVNMMWFLSIFQYQMEVFGRRRFERYCTPYDKSSIALIKTAQDFKQRERDFSTHGVLNTQGYPDNYEYRAYKGSLRTRTILASVEMLEAMTAYCRLIKLKAIEKFMNGSYNTGWMRFLHYINCINNKTQRYSILVKYLKRRGMFLTENGEAELCV